MEENSSWHQLIPLAFQVENSTKKPLLFISRLLVLLLNRKLENQGRNLNCHFITLDTFSFHATEFYQKLGFYEYGRVPKYMLGHDRIYFKKEL